MDTDAFVILLLSALRIEFQEEENVLNCVPGAEAAKVPKAAHVKMLPRGSEPPPRAQLFSPKAQQKAIQLTTEGRILQILMPQRNGKP